LFLIVEQDYIAVKEKSARFMPHSAGRYAAKRFRKALCPVVERLCNSMMMHGRNNGKKLLAVRIVKHSFEIIHLLTGEVRAHAWAIGTNYEKHSSRWFSFFWPGAIPTPFRVHS
jgi:small subunit ribosomal protein S5e